MVQITRGSSFTFLLAVDENSPQIVMRDTSLSPDQFTDLLGSLPTLKATCPDPVRASNSLYMYLMKVRTGLPIEDIAARFGISRTTVRRYMNNTRDALAKDFTPDHINVAQDRDFLIQRSSAMCNGLFNPDGEKIVLVCDGTYIFINKSRNYKVQRETYTDQKKRNNVKIMMIVTTNGYIVHALGPYKAGQNDASILREIDQTTNVFANLRRGDILLLDRGFRDCVDYFKGKGLDAKMPALVQRSANGAQLSTADANQTRLVTALRFVVEARNGHMKSVFKIFNTVWNSLLLPHLVEDFQICAALLNRYHISIESNRPYANELSARMLDRLNVDNKVFEVTRKKEFQKHLKSFQAFESFDELPSLQILQLIHIALGKYQICQAESYCSQHVKAKGKFEVFKCPAQLCRTHFATFFTDDCEPILLLAQLDSRYRNRKYYNSFVLVNTVSRGENAVLGYCCECYNGLRTVGCCSHVMTLIWFTMFKKNRDLPNPAGFLDEFFDKSFDDDVSDEPEQAA